MSFITEHIDILIVFLTSGLAVIISALAHQLYFKLKNINTRNNYREYLVNELEKVNIHEENDNSNQIAPNEHISNPTALSEVTQSVEDIRKQIEISSKKDIIALMLKNNDEVAEYFQISKAQARYSFTLSVITSIVGFILLGFSIYGMLLIENFQLAIIGLVSGSITEVISGTVLWIHNKSAIQLNHYYDALHQNEKFLSAVNMADKLNDEKREEMYIEIIRKQIDIKN